jgi:hypothetical protein
MSNIAQQIVCEHMKHHEEVAEVAAGIEEEEAKFKTPVG